MGANRIMKYLYLYGLAVFGALAVNVAFVVGAFVVGAGLEAFRDAPAPCLYNAETPTRTEAFYSLADAQGYLRSIGVDPLNVPEGYDITSRPGC